MMHGDDPLYRNGGEDRRDFDIPTGLLRVAAIFAVSFWLVSQLPIALVPVGHAAPGTTLDVDAEGVALTMTVTDIPFGDSL